MKKNKMEKSKKGVSVIIGYVLLISFAIIMSIIFYNWAKTYVPQDSIQCPDGVSVFIEDYSYNLTTLNITIKNNGRFDIDGYSIHISNESLQKIAIIDLSPKLIEGGIFLKNSISFGSKDNSFTTGLTKTSLFDISDISNIYLIEIIPTRFHEIKNKKRFISCSDVRIIERI